MGSGEFEIRTRLLNEPSSEIITGYAAVFNSPANIAGQFIERIAPGAFSRTLRERDVVALMHHDHGRVLGRMSSGTLRLREDAHGLWFEIEPEISTPDGATALRLVKRRDLKSMSFGFNVISENWEYDSEDDLPVRTLQEISLGEVSLVTWPAYDTTSASIDRQHNAIARRLQSKAEAAHRARGIRL